MIDFQKYYRKYLKDNKYEKIFGKYDPEFKKENIPIKSSWGLFDNQKNTEMLKDLLGDTIFLNPKPLELLVYLLKSTTNKNAIVLDFMAGSGTTAHAVLELNKEDGGNRKFRFMERR